MKIMDKQQSSHSWVGSQERVAAAGLCLVANIVVQKKVQTEILILIGWHHSDYLLGPKKHLHVLFMCFLPYQVADHVSDNG
jgi:hypothetical protein